MPSGSGSHGQGSYSRVKEERNSFLGMHYDLGMGSGCLEPISDNQHSLDTMHKSRSGSETMEQSDDGDLQALASLLRRK